MLHSMEHVKPIQIKLILNSLQVIFIPLDILQDSMRKHFVEHNNSKLCSLM